MSDTQQDQQTPVADATQQTPAQPAGGDDSKRSKRIQMIDVLDIYVPPPRVRNHFVKKLADVEKYYEFKSQAKKKEDVPAETPVTQDAAASPVQPAEESQDIRLSPEANAALAVTSSTLLVSVIKYAMDNALASKMKRVTVAHFMARKLEGLQGSTLIKHLPVVQQHLSQSEESEAAEDKKEAAAATEQPATEAATSKKDPEFTTYVARAFNDCKTKDAKYAELMLTQGLKSFLSTLLIEFIQSVAPLSMVFIEAMDLKTIKQRVIMKVVKVLMTLSGDFELFNAYKQEVDEKLKLFESYEKGEHEAQKKQEVGTQEEASVATTETAAQ